MIFALATVAFVVFLVNLGVWLDWRNMLSNPGAHADMVIRLGGVQALARKAKVARTVWLVAICVATVGYALCLI